jgi:hypothetical protein
MLSGLGLSTLAASFTPRMLRNAQAGEDSSGPEMLELLFVQSARAASLQNGMVTLSDVHDSTLSFTDRPERITDHEPTEDVVYNWDKGDDSFADDPPNATLSIRTGPEPQEIFVVLRNPRLAGTSLNYEAGVLDGNKTASGGASSLFIDTLGRPASPTSVAGVHHRYSRRRVRHVGPGLR